MHYLTRVDRWKAFVPVANVEQEIRKARITRIRAIKKRFDFIESSRDKYFVLDLLRSQSNRAKFWNIFEYFKYEKKKYEYKQWHN